MTVGERADRTERVLDLLGKPGRSGGAVRPHRLIVVATQLAEQSFDVDVDLLITDLAPIDLLLQRIGRLHRHERDVDARPETVRRPRVVVTGVSRRGEGPPTFPRGSTAVYGDYLLLRSAALVFGGVGAGWSVPAAVPDLVREGYSDRLAVPAGWQDATKDAQRMWEAEIADRQARAQSFLLAGLDELGAQTLTDLHERSTSELHDDDAVAAVVRDGEESIEVILVRQADNGYRTLAGRPLGANADVAGRGELVDELMRSAVRLPSYTDLTSAAKNELRPLPGWTADTWLKRSRALVLDEQGRAELGGRVLTYDHELGLLDERVT